MADDKGFWLTDKIKGEIEDIFKERADKAWGNRADSLLGNSKNGQLFLQQMSLLGDLLGQQGFGVKPHFQNRQVTIDLVDASGKTIPSALRFSLSDSNGGRLIKGAVVKNIWVGYENSLGGGNMTDATTYEVLEMVKALTNDKSAAARAAKSHDAAELIRQLNRKQQRATKKVQSQFRRTQQEIQDEYNSAMNTRSASAIARDNRMVDMSSIIHAIAINRGNRYGTTMYGKVGKSVAIRQQTVDRDVKTMLGALSVAKNPKQARDALVNRFSSKYGIDGINEILNVIIPFSDLGLEVTNVSNGAYAGSRFGATTSNQVGHFFAAKSNVHFKQKDNYNARQKRAPEAYKGLAVSNPLTTKRLNKHGHTGANPEEALFKYLEVSQQDFEDARAAFVEEEINKAIDNERKRLASSAKPRKLSAASEQALRAELHKRMTGISQSLSTLSSDTYGITKEMKEVLDDYLPKNHTFTEAEIERYQKHYKDGRGKWQPRGANKMLDRATAVREMLARQIAGKKKIPYVEALASISDVAENTDYAENVGGVPTANFSYHLNRRMQYGDKILGGQGDRATTFAVQQKFLEFLAQRVGAQIDGSHHYSAVTLQRGVNARNFEEWFLPRMTSLAQRAAAANKTQQFAEDFNRILGEALGGDAYKAMFGGEDYYTQENGRLIRQDMGLSDLFAQMIKNPKARSKKLGEFLVKWGELFSNGDYGFFKPEDGSLLTRGSDGSLVINQALNKKIPLLASFNAIGKDWYGPASTKGAIHLDRRAEYALKREMAEAEMSKGIDFSKYRLATQRWMATTGMSEAELKRRQEEFEAAAGITMGTLSAKKGAKEFDPRDWEGTEASASAWVGGRLLGSEFLKTPLGKIWLNYQEYKKNNGGSGAGYQALLRMPARFSLTKGKGDEIEEFSNDLVAIPTSILEGLSMSKGAGGVDYVSGVSPYHTDLNRLLNHAYENALAAATGGESEQLALNDSVAGLLETIRHDLYDNQGTTYREAHRALIGRSGYVAAEKNDFLDEASLTKALGSAGRAKTAMEIAKTGALLQYNIGHDAYSGRPLGERGETDEAYKERLQRAVWQRELDYERIYANASPEIKERIEKDLAKAGDDLGKRFDILSKYNLRGVTVDDKLFQGLTGGLYGKFARGPHTEGADIISAAMYLTHKGLTHGKGYLAQGAGWRANLDFDGDQFMAMLALNDASIAGMSKEEIADLYKNEQILQDIRKRKTLFADELLRRKRDREAGEETVLKAGDLDLITDISGQSIAEWAGKANFGHTGILDNIRQRLSYNLSTALLDEVGYSARGGDNGKLVNGLIARHVFESMSQDAISSKKILDRYQKKLGTDNEITAYFGFVDDLSNLMNRISKNEEFATDDSFVPFIEKLTDMGILDKDKGFDERISTTLMQDIAAHSASRRYFYENYVKKGKGKLTDEEEKLLDTKQTSDIDFYDYLLGTQTKNGERPAYFHFTPEMIANVLAETNKDLTAAEAVKKIFLPGKGVALGRALTYSSLMPGKEGDDPFKEFGSGGNPASGSGGGSDPMNKAANTLLKAAEALLQLAKGGVGGGGGYGGHAKRMDENAFVPAHRYFSGTAAAKVLRPGSYSMGGNAAEFINTIKANSDKENLGYDSQEALIQAFGSWWAPMSGTQVGNLYEMINDAEKQFNMKLTKDGALLPLDEIEKKIKARRGDDTFKAWKKQLFNGGGGSGTDKSFWKQYEDFQAILSLIGDDRLKILTRNPQASVASILENIQGGVAAQYEQVQNTLLGHVVGREGDQIKKFKTLGTEVGVSAAMSQNLGLSGFLDTLHVVETGAGHKAFATVDLKRLANGKPTDDQMIQMFVYQTILDDLTTAVMDSWGKGNNKATLETAYKNFQKTRHGKNLKWTQDQFALTEGIDTDALVAMSIIDGENKGKSVYLDAHSSTKQFLKEYILGALEENEPLDDLKMQIIAKAFSSSITGEALHGSADSQIKADKGPIAAYQTKYGLTQTKMNELGVKTAWYQERLEKGLYGDFTEKAEIEKTLEKLGIQYQELQNKLAGYREQVLKTATAEEQKLKLEEQMLQAEREMSDVLSQQQQRYQAQADIQKIRYQKKEMRTYEQLLDQYNQQVAGYESDALAYKRSTNSLEKKSLSFRMQDREKMIHDSEEAIADEREKLLAMGINEKEIAKLEATGAAKLRLLEDNMMVRAKGIGSIWDSLATSFKNIITRFTQMGMAYSILNKIKKAFGEIVQSATQLDKAMVDLRVVTGLSYEEARNAIHGYAKLAGELAATTLEVTTAAQEWLRQGYEMAEVNGLVESSIKLSVLGMMSASDATKALTSAMKGFKMEAGDVSQIVDKFTSLDMHAATTAGDIATALSKFATTAQMAGVDIDQAAAMATTIMDVSQNDAGATGNALKTIFSRFGNVKAGTYEKMSGGDNDDTTDKINDIERVLNTLGIQVRTSARDMRDFDDVLGDVAEKWQFLDKVSQNAIATAVAGTRQRESFAVLMNNYEKYQELLEVSQNSGGTADQKYQSYLDQLEASQKRLKAAWEDIANDSGLATFMTNINNFLSGAVKTLPLIIRYATKLFLVLNSYKMPKLLSGFFGVGDVKETGGKVKSFFGSNFTSAGIAAKAEAYNAKGFKRPFDILYGAANDAATALEAVAAAGNKVAGKGGQSTPSGQPGSSGQTGVPASQPGAAGAAAATGAVVGAAAPMLFNGKQKTAYERAKLDLKKAEKALSEAGDPLSLYFDYVPGVTDDEDWEAGLENYNLARENHQIQKKQVEQLESEARRRAERQARTQRMFAPSKQGAMMAGVGAATSLVQGMTMGQQGMNWSDMGAGLQQASSGASAVATANSTLSNIGYIWGPIIGMAANTLADVLNKFFIIPLMDREANERKARVQEANKRYEQIAGIADNVTALTDYAKKETISSEENAEMVDQVYQLLSGYYSMDKDARAGIETYLLRYLDKLGFKNIGTMYDAMQQYLNGTQEERETISKVLTYAQRMAGLDEDVDRNEESRAKTDSELRKSAMYNSGDRPTNSSGFNYTRLYEIAEGRGYKGEIEHDDNRHRVVTHYIDTSTMSYDLHEYLDMIDEVLKSLDDKTSKEYKYYEELRKNVADIAATRKQELDAYNKQAVLNAMLISEVSKDAGLLLDQTIDQLKSLGIEEIMKIIGKQIYDQGGLNGYSLYIGDDSNNGLTEYAERIIRQAILSDSRLSGILLGNAYSLMDLRKDNGFYDWDNRKQEYRSLVESFAAALNISQYEFLDRLENGDLAEKFGHMTLGDFLKTPEELRQSMEELSSLFTSLSNNTFLTADKLETIINKFPTLIKYLGDTDGMMGAMISSFGEYAQVYTNRIFNSLMTNEDYAATVKEDLRKSGQFDDVDLLKIFGDDKTIKQMVDTLKKGPALLGLEEEAYNNLVQWIQGLFDEIDVGQIFMRQLATETVMPYLDLRLDRELEALNKQKEALQQINKQREYENKLIEARNKLEEAGKEKRRVWREGVGWVYEANQEQIAEAQKNLQDVENERAIREIDIQIEQVQAQKELIKAIQDDAKFKAMEDAMTELLGTNASEAGINGLINITKGLYNGSDSIGESLPGIGENLVELKTLLSQLLEKQFDVDYKTEGVKDLMERAKSSNPEESASAIAELNSRGYTENESGGWDYAVPKSGENIGPKDIQNAITAYKSGASNAEEIKTWLEGKNYQWSDAEEDFVQVAPKVRVIGKDGNKSGGDAGIWTRTDSPLAFGTDYYQWLEGDFKRGKMAYYVYDEKDKAYKWAGDTTDHKTEYLDDFKYWISKHPNTVINGWDGATEMAIISGNSLYGLVNKQKWSSINDQSYAQGTLEASGGVSLVNELGTEAIITPQGTVTALPSRTGIVPADVTRNLWELGEAAPAIARLMDPIIRPGSSTAIGDSFNVQSMNVYMNPDGGFDVDRFVNELKTAVSLRKNS